MMVNLIDILEMVKKKDSNRNRNRDFVMRVENINKIH
jgi:hypothetical protein